MIRHLPVHIAFVTDGSPGQIIGIATVLLSMKPTARRVSRLWIAAPESAQGFCRRWMEPAGFGAVLEFVPARRSETDRYYVQTSLADIFKEIPGRDVALCIDYDHVIFAPNRLIAVAEANVSLVSSEVRSVESAYVNRVFSGLAPLQWVNTSFISGAAGVLSKIGDGWDAAYEDLSDTPWRFRVETAFGLAAARASAHLNPVAATIQSNFSSWVTGAASFHYGGDSALSQAMKGILDVEADRLSLIEPTSAALIEVQGKLARLLGSSSSAGTLCDSF